MVKHFDKYHGWHNYPDDRFSDLFNLTPIEKVPVQASFEKTKEFRLNREQFWIDTLNTVEPCGMNIATSKPKRKNEQIPLIIPFSRTAKTASDIVNHHFQILKQELPDVFEHQITTAYSRHNNLRNQLVRSALPALSQ